MTLEARTAPGRAGLTALLAAPGRALLAVDFDGTLAPIVADPGQARAHPRVLPALVRLADLLGRIAVVTGRPAAQAVELGGLGAVPRLTVLGHYGLERWSDGDVRSPGPPAGLAAVRAALPDLLVSAGAGDARIEDKQLSVAVHTRPAAEPVAAFDRLRGPVGELAAAHGLVVEPGRLVLEIRADGMDKGRALRLLVDEDRPSAVVFIGDDLGDLPAFAAVDALRADGVPGLLVCSGSDEVTALARRADLVVDGPAGVADVLTALAGEIGG